MTKYTAFHNLCMVFVFCVFRANDFQSSTMDLDNLFKSRSEVKSVCILNIEKTCFMQ